LIQVNSPARKEIQKQEDQTAIMAAVPTRVTENVRRTSSENRAALSYGRGGAGRFIPSSISFYFAISATAFFVFIAHLAIATSKAQ
jgi:hypothetical protein